MKEKLVDRRPIVWIFRHGRRQLPLLVLQIFCNVFLSASSVWFALLVGRVIDSAVSISQSAVEISHLISSATTLAFLILLQLVLRFLCQYLGDKLVADLEFSLRLSTYRSLLYKEYAGVSAFHTGDLMTHLYSDVSVVSDGAATILPNVAATITRLICAVGVMIFLEWRFTLLFVCAGSVVFAASRLFSGTLKRLHKRTQEADARTRSFVQETLSGMVVLKVFDAQEATAEKTDRLQKEHLAIRMKKKLIGALANVGFSAIFKIGYFAALVYCSLSLAGVITSSSAMTYGTLMAILQLVNQIQMPFGSLSGILPKYYAMCASAERLQHLTDLPAAADMSDTSVDRTNFYASLKSLVFSEVTFAYEQEPVLESLNLSVEKGDFCVITGLSGIGKSTLLKLLLGVYSPSKGEILLETEMGTRALAERAQGMFAYVPQGNLLFSGTIRENIMFVRENATEDELAEATRIACVDDFLSDLPSGLDTVIGENGFGLSEGQAQRIAIARALLHGAPILLLDESTSALDNETELRFLHALSELKDKTCIIISHKNAAFEICDYEIVIRDKTAEKRELRHE